MIPEPDKALQIIMGTLTMDVAPNMRDDYRQANVNLLGFVALLIAEEFDRAADVRVSENRELRTLFADAASVVADPDLRTRLAAAAGTVDAGVRVTVLTAANSELRRLLIELHASVEKQGTPAAAEIAVAIWGFLRRSTERRAIGIG